MLPPEGVEHVCACVYMPGTESAAQGHTLLARGARELASGIEQLVPASSGPSWVCVRCRFIMQSFRCRCVNSLHLFAFLLRRRAAARCPFVCMSSPMSCVCVFVAQVRTRSADVGAAWAVRALFGVGALWGCTCGWPRALNITCAVHRPGGKPCGRVGTWAG